jgi:hypothetical protein
MVSLKVSLKASLKASLKGSVMVRAVAEKTRAH